MAESAISFAYNQQGQSYFNGTISNGVSSRVDENTGITEVIKYNPGITTEWNSEEQKILENGLTKYASMSSFIRFAKIALELPNKTIRDVALRARWMNKKEASKRRKEDDARTSKRVKIAESSSKPVAHPYHKLAVPLDEGNGISSIVIGGSSGELLSQNKHFFQKISSNFKSNQLQENINLLCQARENLIKVLNTCKANSTLKTMTEMPPLPVKLNEEYSNLILPTTQSNEDSPSVNS